jgi:hypothetical protein
MPLPLILAGPIVRRVTARSVSVWVALAEGADVTLSIWDKVIATGTDTSVYAPTDAAIYSASRHTLRMGNKLHIALVTIDLPPAPAAPLFPGKLYSYNLSFNPASGNADLKSLGLLLDKFPTSNDPIPNLALGYTPGFLPSFLLPPVTIDKLNLVHGSCRKMHGPGKDTLAVLDTLIQRAVNDNDPDKRPHQLFLTGDQIYSDEIPILLLPYINALGQQLLGMTENLSVKKQNGTPGTYEASLANFSATRRQRIVTHNAKFSTGEGANHLLSFGEFAAAYLMGWNNAVWSADLYAEDSVLKAKTDFLTTWDTDPLTTVEQDLAPLDSDEQKKYAAETTQQKADRIKKIKAGVQDHYDDELKQVLTFRAQLPKVRRVLANVPVYMILDDHEVTDDWYITKDWRDKVLTAPLGVNILRNALMAYTLFQDWGNLPSSYTTPQWAASTTYQKNDYIKPTTENDHLYIATQGGQSGAAQPSWPTTKGADVGDGSVIWREAGSDKKADLLNQLQLVFPNGAASGPAGPPADAIDVLFGFNLTNETPPPVFWHYSVPSSETTTYVLDTRTRRTYETRYSPPGLLSKSAMDDQIPMDAQAEKFLIFVSPAPVLGLGLIEELLQPTVTLFSQYEADPEPWSFAPAVFEEFLQRLQKFKRVVFLSGDIHFGLAATLDYWKQGEAQPTRFIQYVSSGLKNQKFNNEKFLMSGFVQKLLGNLFYPAERLGWAHRAGLQVTNPAGKSNQPSGRLRLRREPVLLPTHGWPAGSTVNHPPEWSWRMVLAADQRPDDSSVGARPANIQVHSITPDVNPTTGDAGAEYHKVLARHVDIFKKSVGRRVEWDNNIGIIKFTTDGSGNLSASQQLWYWLPGDELDDDPDAYTVFSDKLEPTSDTSPSIT